MNKKVFSSYKKKIVDLLFFRLVEIFFKPTLQTQLEIISKSMKNLALCKKGWLMQVMGGFHLVDLIMTELKDHIG